METVIELYAGISKAALIKSMEKVVVVVRRGRYNNKKVYYGLSQDLVTCDVHRNISTYCTTSLLQAKRPN